MAEKKVSGKTATFERCAELRERAGLSVDALVQLCGGRPARSSIQRLEKGYGIMTHNTFKVASTINRALQDAGSDGFNVDEEVQRL